MEPSDLSRLNVEQLKELQSTLRHMIDHMAQRIEYAETRRSVIAVVAGALLAAGVALLTLALTEIAYLPLSSCLVTLSAATIALTMVLFYVYGKQTNFPYPFTETTQTWKWFYRYALADYNKFDAPWAEYVRRTASFRNEGKNQFDEQWKIFERQQIEGLTNLPKSTMQDLEQVYLLHVNERYKNLFLTQLRTVLLYGLILSVLLAALGFVGGLLYQGTSTSRESGLYRTDNLTVESSWRATGETRSAGIGGDEVQLLLNVRVQNRGEDHVDLRALAPVDDEGLQLPAFVDYVDPKALSVSPNSTGEATMLVWVPVGLSEQIRYFEVSS